MAQGLYIVRIHIKLNIQNLYLVHHQHMQLKKFFIHFLFFYGNQLLYFWMVQLLSVRTMIVLLVISTTKEKE